MALGKLSLMRIGVGWWVMEVRGPRADRGCRSSCHSTRFVQPRSDLGERWWRSADDDLRSIERLHDLSPYSGVGTGWLIMAADRIRALTTPHQIKPTSTSSHSAWRPKPGRRSTYQRGDFVQTTGTSSGGYQGPLFRRAMAKKMAQVNVEIVKRSDRAKGFIVLPKRAHVRVAWTMQAPGQGLGKSQPPRPRIPTSRVDQAHAENAMQSNMIFPDRLLESVVSIRITSLWASLAAASLMSHSLGVRSKSTLLTSLHL